MKNTPDTLAALAAKAGSAWWAVSNGTTHYYGFGTLRQAEVYSDLLNSRDGREFNLFHVEEVDAEESESLNTWRTDGLDLTDEIENFYK